MAFTKVPILSDQTNQEDQTLTSGEIALYDQKWINTLTKVLEWELFTSHNLFQWTSYIERQLPARKLMDHLPRESPNVDDPAYFKWIGNESIMFEWLLESMTPKIAELLEYEPSCKSLWEAADMRHLKREDEAKTYELVSSAYTIKQGKKSILEFASELITISKELDHYRPLSPDSVDRVYILRDCVYLFLLELNDEYEAFRVQIFNRTKNVPIDNVILATVHEESRLKVFAKHGPQIDQMSSPAFIGPMKDKKTGTNQNK